ncbi:EAL domain-containing protein [Klebsiella pneumoniae]|nr:EAL domain-containing protein [Klebsiella pneumoniae]
MLDALNSEAIQVHYQPIILARTENCRGRGPARWQYARWHFLSPDIFIPLAEQTGLITQLTEDIVRKIFTDLGPGRGSGRKCTHIHQPVGR